MRQECLTPRELQVAGLLAVGFSRVEIATKIGCSPLTVRGHLSVIYTKVGAWDALEAVLRLAERGILNTSRVEAELDLSRFGLLSPAQTKVMEALIVEHPPTFAAIGARLFLASSTVTNHMYEISKIMQTHQTKPNKTLLGMGYWLRSNKQPKT